jgi:succinate dehydrogenase/fumarate reductase flavoprotein subunit
VPIKGGDAAADGHQAAFQNAMIISAKEINAGNGTPGDGRNNGLYFSIVDIENESNNQSYPSYKGFLKFSSENLGYSYPEYVETIANQYSSCGCPQQNAETCESEIPGLYPVFVALSNFSSMWNSGQAYLAAKDASQKAAHLDTLPAYANADVDRVLSAAYGLLDAAPADGVRASEVHRSIQRAFYEGQDFIKSGEKIQTMIDELERIKKEDVPRMVCVDKSRAFNGDWRRAMEVESLLNCSLGTAHAALYREETRSPFFRSDYPKMDNDRLLCFLWTSLDSEGKWTVEKGRIPDATVSTDELARIMGEIDISNPEVRGAVGVPEVRRSASESEPRGVAADPGARASDLCAG